MHLDGPLQVLSAFTGIVGKALHTCLDLEVVNFKSIHRGLIHLTGSEDPSKDQKYLFEMHLPVNRESVSEGLAIRES